MFNQTHPIPIFEFSIYLAVLGKRMHFLILRNGISMIVDENSLFSSNEKYGLASENYLKIYLNNIIQFIFPEIGLNLSPHLYLETDNLISSEELKILHEITQGKYKYDEIKIVFKDGKINYLKTKERKKNIEELLGIMNLIPYGDIKIKKENGKIESLERQRRLLEEELRKFDTLDTSFGTAVDQVCNFIQEPVKVWRNGNLEEKQNVLKMVFTRNLSYHKEKQGLEASTSPCHSGFASGIMPQFL